jgi:hypothetical protein
VSNMRVGAKVQWQWMGRFITGIIKEVYTEPVSRSIQGKMIQRNGSVKNPAYLVESVAGNMALKLQSELRIKPKESIQRKQNNPTMFSED